MKIAIGNDHAAVEMKQDLIAYLTEKGHEVTNFGTDTNDSCDYPDYAKKVCDAVNAKEADFGILCCGTGAGMCIAANKIKGIRAMLCDNTTTAHLVKEHNNCNVITLGARVTGLLAAHEIVDAYMGAEFMGGNHERRINKFMAFEAE